ncbi:DAPG hydrolase family protein [Massilia sp. YIM B04103]|uniref:DAPG hydrolase family protein n=1 Tax=Massilia sp. YIM B04103 TaxID=2963106 RepID=UPI00210B11AC|nr:hydrolase [Massilia sp. YIM B04103]
MKPNHTAAQWDLPEIEQLLERRPVRLETGITRNAAGQLVVAVRTDMQGCKGRMLDWWFKYFETTQHIKWWHPHDHVEHRGWDSKWKKGESYIGASIHAVESLSDIPPVAAKLKFHAPEEAFAPDRLRLAYAQGDVAAAVYARIGFGDHIQLDEDGDPQDGHMLHIASDTPFGCVLRSRFLLGLSAAQPLDEVPDHLGLSLMRHCYTEFTYLSRFLPSLYYGEHANGEAVPLPW